MQWATFPRVVRAVGMGRRQGRTGSARTVRAKIGSDGQERRPSSICAKDGELAREDWENASLGEPYQRTCE